MRENFSHKKYICHLLVFFSGGTTWASIWKCLSLSSRTTRTAGKPPLGPKNMEPFPAFPFNFTSVVFTVKCIYQKESILQIHDYFPPVSQLCLQQKTTARSLILSSPLACYCSLTARENKFQLVFHHIHDKLIKTKYKMSLPDT